jgi:hypothetical protein
MSRKPDFRLKLLNKVTNDKCINAGAGWLNSDGSINIQLDPFVYIKNNKDIVITLFPINLEDKP